MLRSLIRMLYCKRFPFVSVIALILITIFWLYNCGNINTWAGIGLSALIWLMVAKVFPLAVKGTEIFLLHASRQGLVRRLITKLNRYVER